MATLHNKILFFTTSPRTPAKMIPEIALLWEKFENQIWNIETQVQFIDELAQSDYFEGLGSKTDKALSARDRITRAPKALGFVDLKPTIQLTDAGKAFISGKRPEEIFLRQLLKFQIPSPFHREDKFIKGTFWVKPYLEIIRLIRELGFLTFDELKIFGLQLTDFHKYEYIKDKILKFRSEKKNQKGKYKKFVDEVWTNEIKAIYSEKILTGNTKTRETRDATLTKFISTKKGNSRDYADACIRYLRYTGMISISHRNREIAIFEDKYTEIDFILSTIDRNPVYVNDEAKYKVYLFSNSEPALYNDNKESVIKSILRYGKCKRSDLIKLDLNCLKDIRDEIFENKRTKIIQSQIEALKSYSEYSDIMTTFKELTNREYYDAPLMLEYNTWRAMTMLDDGEIKGNFKFDDIGQPLSTAPGNMPDIECNYKDFILSIEVTMQMGQTQYEAEGEPVARHFGKLKKKSGKETYCLFIAPKINHAALAHFYGLNHMNISYYGGQTQIIPLTLSQFMRLIEISNVYRGKVTSADIKNFLDNVLKQGNQTANENEWDSCIQYQVENWLSTYCGRK